MSMTHKEPLGLSAADPGTATDERTWWKVRARKASEQLHRAHLATGFHWIDDPLELAASRTAAGLCE